MRRATDILVLPGPGRATRQLRVTRAKLWWWAGAAIVLCLLALAAGFLATDALLGSVPGWANL